MFLIFTLCYPSEVYSSSIIFLAIEMGRLLMQRRFAMERGANEAVYFETNTPPVTMQSDCWVSVGIRHQRHYFFR